MRLNFKEIASIHAQVGLWEANYSQAQYVLNQKDPNNFKQLSIDKRERIIDFLNKVKARTNFFKLNDLDNIGGAVYFYHYPNTPCFSLKFDTIEMPMLDYWGSEGEFYRVIFHELTHWSGGANRLNRNFNFVYGSEEYAFEELIAELGSLYLSEMMGLNENDYSIKDIQHYILDIFNSHFIPHKNRESMLEAANLKALEAVQYLEMKYNNNCAIEWNQVNIAIDTLSSTSRQYELARIYEGSLSV